MLFSSRGGGGNGRFLGGERAMLGHPGLLKVCLSPLSSLSGPPETLLGTCINPLQEIAESKVGMQGVQSA